MYFLNGHMVELSLDNQPKAVEFFLNPYSDVPPNFSKIWVLVSEISCEQTNGIENITSWSASG